jgi:hypothetical protein
VVLLLFTVGAIVLGLLIVGRKALRGSNPFPAVSAPRGPTE